MLPIALSVPQSPSPPVPLLAQATTAEILSGQELIYRGRFDAAQLYFASLALQYPRDPVGPILEASALVWWGEARGEGTTFQLDSIDLLLDSAIARAQLAADSATSDSARSTALFWLGSAFGYRARQADLRGSTWRAARDAKAMRQSLERALALDSSCIDCLAGIGAYDYALARANALARFVARIIGLGRGNAERGLESMRRASEQGLLWRTESRWVYANQLLLEGSRDAASREEGLRIIGDLAAQFPENPVFRRALGPAGTAP
jgi:hypothetical protein